jgi:hypothetical protein
MNSRFPVLASILTVAALSLLAAGCGGGGKVPGVASVASSTTTSTTAGQGALVAYAQCMRSHGVPGFPGPDSTGQIPKQQVVAIAQSANQSTFNAAQSDCSHLLPESGLGAPPTEQQIQTKIADGVSFAKCMRSHGVARFPDPTAQGQLTVEMVEAQGIDVHSPAVLRVVQECLPASHGALTPAKVAQAINGNGGQGPPPTRAQPQNG